jgi:hypothetical protein
MFRACNKMAGDCPNFAESSEQNGTGPFSEVGLLHALGSFLTFVGNPQRRFWRVFAQDPICFTIFVEEN